MADYYTHFSAVMALDEEQTKYALDLHKRCAAACMDSDEAGDQQLPFEPEILEQWYFGCSGEKWSENAGIWIYDSSNGGLDAACEFVKHLLAKFHPHGYFSLEWSNGCSKPRTDAYGGGAAFITATEIKWMNTHNWLDGQRVAFLERVGLPV